MLATRGDHVPTGDGWAHEVKWDGMRILADCTLDRIRLTSRNENDVTVTFPELHPLAGRDLLLDGEVVAFSEGLPNFGALADRIHVHKAARAAILAERNPATYLIFDVLRLDGRDLTSETLATRRDILKGLGLVTDRWQVPEEYDDGAMLWDATRAQGLEGVVSKRLASRYEVGRRSPHWLKFPHRRRRSWVVGGWRHETDSTSRIGAVLVGEQTPEGLVYRGRVGSGLAGAKARALQQLLAPLTRADSPFADEVPKLDALGAQWVEPVVVVDVESLGFSPAMRLRQPAYIGVRTDLQAEGLES